MNTLVWVEHDNASVKDATLSAVTAAAKLGEVHLLVAGAGIGGVAEAAAKVAGVTKVVTCGVQTRFARECRAGRRGPDARL